MAGQIAGLYDLEETLGSGHFAVVKSARHVFTGLRVAVKVIDKAKLDEISKAHLYQEVRCMKLVTHPSIIRLYEVIDTQSKLYLIQELGDGGDLYDFIMQHPTGIQENVARHIFRQTVAAICYCHKLHVVHRDLKPENLVFCTGDGREPPRVKLTDFGLSRTFLPGELIESACGSLEYSAPEILLGDSYDAPKIDVWSLGVILYMLITGRSPFAYGGASETLTHIMDGRYPVPAHASEPCISLISTMLVVDAQCRASLDEVATNQWLQEGKEDDLPSLSFALPTISNIDELPQDDIDLILHRMEMGGYGTQEDVLRSVTETPYGSTAATFYLLAEAERHRRITQPPTTPSRQRKMSMPAVSPPPALTNGPLTHFPRITPSPMRVRGGAETGVLQPRRFTAPAPPCSPRHPTSLSHTPAESQHPDTSEFQLYRRTIIPGSSPMNTSPLRPYQMYSSPHRGVGGEQVSLGHSPKPAFPLNIQSSSVEEPPPPPPAIVSYQVEHMDHTSGFRSTRQLSTFLEEESETESIPDMITLSRGPSRGPSTSPHGSPLHSPRSRRILNARSSPNIFLSKSDASEEDDEEEDEDDIVELITSSGRFPNKKCNTFPRLSPMNSPLLTSRRSPTATSWTGSSDDEISGVFETTRNHRSKRHPYRKRSSNLSRVDSLGSDDGVGKVEQQTSKRLRKRRDNLLRMRGYASVPNASTDVSASESLTELLENIRSGRQRSGSARTDSSLSGGEMNDLANCMVSKFEPSDDEGDRSSMDTDADHKERTTTLRSVFCKIL